MTRRTLVALAVVGLLLIGGCQGSGQSVTTESFPYPDGYDESGISNTSTALRTHATALDGGYRINFTLSQVGSRGAVRTSGYVRANESRKRAIVFVEQTTAGHTKTFTEFRAGDAVYRQHVSGGSFEYAVRNEAYRAPIYADRGDFVSMVRSLELNASEAFAVNGTRYVRYRVENVTADRIQATIANESGTVVIEESGRIRSMNVTFEQRVTGVERTVSFVYVTTRVNTTVERPEWVATAKNESKDRT
ncbi:MAG: hypothetical protein ACI9PP_001273 [Halobacteriales archaeon]|jgi:hypothetical protein